jgi:hypothetical protein
MSLAIAIADYRMLGDYEYEPISDGSKVISRRWALERNYLKGSASDWLPTVDAALKVIREECQRAGWDGPGSLAISDRVIAITTNAVGALFTLVPKGIPAPDVIPEADGEICLHWVVESEREMSISIGAHGKINFAGQFGKDGGVHGWQPVDATSERALDRSLQEIAKYVARLFAPIVSPRAA